MTTLLPSDDDDDIPSWLKEYYLMDPDLRRDFREERGLTERGMRAVIAAHERKACERKKRLRAARESAASTDAADVVQTDSRPGRDVRIEVLLGGGGGWIGSRTYRSAPPARGNGAAGPGRPRSGGRRWRGSAGDPAVLIVIMLPGS